MFNGKALYNPGGKAGEYGRWAINFYNGCYNGCDYCYLNKGVYASVMGRGVPRLKESLKNTNIAIETIEDVAARILPDSDEAKAYVIAVTEIKAHREEIIRDGGVFFSFSTDPCLDETIKLTLLTALCCVTDNIPVTILTKCADWVYSEDTNVRALMNAEREHGNTLAVGFTLTGHDEFEKGASPNAERLRAMKHLHDNGILAWASIEPVIDFSSSLKMIRESVPFCDHFKVGLLSGAPKGTYTLDDTVDFINDVRGLLKGTRKTVYWKKSIRDVIGGGSPIGYNFVEADWNIFTGDLDKRTF